MKKWQKFENECFNYLEEKYKDKANLYLEGGSNSNISDIHVITFDGDDFYIEVKRCPAQCGQFVLLPDNENKKFIFSSANASTNDIYAEKIINFMNSNYDEFANNSGTKGKEILFNGCEKIFAEWIIEQYKRKNVKYFITNNFEMFPIDDFFKHFTVKAKYRMKRSGSSNPSKANSKLLSEYLTNSTYQIEEAKIINNKLLVKTSLKLNNVKFKFNDNEYMFRENEDSYEIRKLSNTYNSNVIFSISSQ